MTPPRTFLVGIGSPHGDDQAGWLVADRLSEVLPREIVVRQAATPSQLLDWLSNVDRLIICDAVGLRPNAESQSADRAEGIRCDRWTWPTAELSALRSASSHAFGLVETLTLAEKLGTLPDDVIVFGVTGRQFAPFSEVSPELRARLPDVVEDIRNELAADVSCRIAEQTRHA